MEGTAKQLKVFLKRVGENMKQILEFWFLNSNNRRDSFTEQKKFTEMKRINERQRERKVIHAYSPSTLEDLKFKASPGDQIQPSPQTIKHFLKTMKIRRKDPNTSHKVWHPNERSSRQRKNRENIWKITKQFRSKHWSTMSRHYDVTEY